MFDLATDYCQIDGCETEFSDLSEAEDHYESQHEGHILVDTREKDEEILSEVARVCREREVGWIPVALESGDYVYRGTEQTVAIEFKNITDAVNSALDDRLYEQANRMAQEYDRAFVFIVGKTSEVQLRGRNIGYGQAYGQIMGTIPQILAKMNMPVQWIRNEEQFADIGIRTLLDAGDRGLEDNELVLVSPGVSSDSQQAVIQSFSGVGGSASERILEEFGSVRGVMNASYSELQQVEGIGGTTARKIWNTFHLDWDGPGFDAKTTDHPMWRFLDTDGIGTSSLLEVWEDTDGLESGVPEYLDELDWGSHREELLREAIEEYQEQSL